MNKYLVKIAKTESKSDSTNSQEELRPHTVRALKRFNKGENLLIDHSMGSGKTLLFLKALESYQKKHPKEQSLIIAPASLTTNVNKEIKKHGVNIDTSRLETLSYEKATLMGAKLRGNKYGLVIMDEAHKMRGLDTQRSKELGDVVSNSSRKLLLTGTPYYNHPSDVSPLINMIAGRKVLPEGKAAFESEYVDKKVEQPPLLKRILGHPAVEKHNLKRREKLKKILQKYVDHYDLKDDPSAADKFPTKTEKVVEVPMSSEQHALYRYMENKLPWHLKLKVRMNMPLDKRDSAALNSFSSGVRQVSNSLHSFMPAYEGTTPKIKTAVDSLEQSHKKDKNFRGLVYSNFLHSGLSDYSKELTKRNIKHSVYHGGLNKDEKDRLLEEYNSGKNKVMLISSSGTEGLNTKGTKKVQVLEPHHNASKIQQVVARAVRFESHEHLPKAERNVEVEHYHSVLPARKFNIGPKQHSIDQYLHHHSKTKNELSNQMTSLVKTAARFEVGHHEFERAKYKETKDWSHIQDPVGSLKRDGAAFFMIVGQDGHPRFLSRRPSKHGGYPDRTANIPHLAQLHMPGYEGQAFHVELMHTGHDYHDEMQDSHPVVSGILNSKPDRAIATQKVMGPVRAMLLDVVNPRLGTYKEKLDHMAKLRQAVGSPDFFVMPSLKIGKDEITQLQETSRTQGHEGLIVTSLTAPEEKNVRVKVKHVDTYNLRVVDMIQEVDIFGNPKESMGALTVADASDRIVANVGTGFTRDMRKEIWKNRNTPDTILGKLIQVKAMPTTAKRLRSPVYNGEADGELDLVGTD